MRRETESTLNRLLLTHEETEFRHVANDAWARMDPAERVEALTGHSLDKCRDILDLPMKMAIISPTVMNGQVQVVRAIFHAITRMGMESQRLRSMQQEVLGQLIDDFDAEEARRNGNGAAR